MAAGYVKNPRGLVKVGDEVKVRVAEIKEDGKIGLSMLSKEEEERVKKERQSKRSNRGNGRRNGGRNNRRH
jgi:predicted RNA-binding protein with RPS1 domain